MNKSGTSQLTVLLEAEIKQKLEMLAEVRGQTAEQLASEAIVRFLGHAEKMTAAEQAALESWEHYKATGLHLTMAEADTWLAQLEEGHDVEPPPCHR
ncbi:CopG family transcriptional regulator [Duganella sp. FT109W]|uniref:CopG family transcriptional regulator n=1 Tax=Duganella margarita TaxID=2692170 RepID=A0ABW9WEY3_9BURK|nr:CopG family transcriptional regulator [Duganella margarita]MYN38974.1 CopG family transcriptional regulator [Duganella margarita]